MENNSIPINCWAILPATFAGFGLSHKKPFSQTVGQLPQSTLQVEQFSFPLHVPSPQEGTHCPQSSKFCMFHHYYKFITTESRITDWNPHLHLLRHHYPHHYHRHYLSPLARSAATPPFPAAPAAPAAPLLPPMLLLPPALS